MNRVLPSPWFFRILLLLCWYTLCWVNWPLKEIWGHVSIIVPLLSAVFLQLSSWCGWLLWCASFSVLPSTGYCPGVLQAAPGSAAPPARPPCWAEARGSGRSLPVLELHTGIIHRGNLQHGQQEKCECKEAATGGFRLTYSEVNTERCSVLVCQDRSCCHD